MGIDFKASAPQVEHHVVLFVLMPGALEDEMWAGTVAGIGNSGAGLLPPGFARRLPKGTRFIVQVHYTPNGTPQTDVATVGIHFAREKPRRQAELFICGSQKIDIPPFADNVEITSECPEIQRQGAGDFVQPPHASAREGLPNQRSRARRRGSNADLFAQISRSIGSFQHEPADPLFFPEGTVLRSVAHITTTASATPTTPTLPHACVSDWQTWDEMMQCERGVCLR